MNPFDSKQLGLAFLSTIVVAGCAASADPGAASGASSLAVSGPAAVTYASVKHVVSFRFKESVPQATIDEAVARFRALKDQVPTILDLDVRYRSRVPTGQVDAADLRGEQFSHTFLLTFATDADRDAYVDVEPHHQAFKAFVGPLLEQAFVIDYETPYDHLPDPQYESAVRRDVYAFQVRADAPAAQVASLVAAAQALDPSGVYLTVGANNSTEGAAGGYAIAAIVGDDDFASVIGRGSGDLVQLLAPITSQVMHVATTPFTAAIPLAPTYRQIWSCANQTARVYVDAADRTKVALVVAGDDRIMSYLSYPMCGGQPGPERACPIDGSATFFDAHAASPSFGEIAGHQASEVGAPADFAGFVVDHPSSNGAPSTTSVTRDGDLLRLDLVDLVEGSASGSSANWVFHGCVAVAAN